MMAFTGMMVLVTFAIGAAGASNLEVETVPNVILVSGKETTLTCGYNRRVFAVYWRYKSPSSPLELLVALDKHYQAGERSGPGYEEGRFNITDDYSLIIHDVQAHDEGTYICEVSDFITGRAIRNSTEVSVIVMAEHPFPSIGQCEDNASPCTLPTYKGQHIIELTCSVAHVKPTVELSWTSAEHVGKAMSEASMKTTHIGDGVFDQTLTITIDTSKLDTDINDFICNAEGLAVSGGANQTIAIYDTEYKAFSPAAYGMIAAGVIIIIVAMIATFTFIWYSKSSTKLDRIRTSIEKYPSKKHMECQNMTLGIFGSAKSGKSTFINYIRFAQKDYWAEDGKATTTDVIDDTSEKIEDIDLTNTIKLRNYKGTIEEFCYQLKEPSGNAEVTKIHEIDCPILVCNYRNYMKLTEPIVTTLLTDLCCHFDMMPMVVIRNNDDSDQCSEMKDHLIKNNKIPTDHIFIFEDYRRGGHAARSVKLLDFVCRCLKVGEKNQLSRKNVKKIDEDTLFL